MFRCGTTEARDGGTRQIQARYVYVATVQSCGRVCEWLSLGVTLWTSITLCCVAQEAGEFESIISGDLPSGWEDALPTFTPEDKGLATRLHSQTMLNALATAIPGQHTLAYFHGNLCCVRLQPHIMSSPALAPRSALILSSKLQSAFA